MRPPCSLCGKKLSIFSASRKIVNGAYYCDECFVKNLENFIPQPIPDNWIGKTLNADSAKRISDSELALYTDGVFSKVHILLSEAKNYSCVTTYYFWGVDHVGRRLVYITYDDDWEYPIGVSILSLTVESFIKKITPLPAPVRIAFAAFSEKNIENYMSISFPFDLTVGMAMFFQTFGDNVKVLYTSHAGNFYAIVPKNDFENWRKGKKIFECIFKREELVQFALVHCTNKYVFGPLLPFLYYKKIKVDFVECEQANCLVYHTDTKQVQSLVIPITLIDQNISAFEKKCKIQA